MQKARGQALPCGHSASTACRYTGSGTISSPNRGAFHLSLTVLVHYRSPEEYLALGHGRPRFPRGSTCPVVIGNSAGETPNLFTYGLSPSMAALSRDLLLGWCFITPRTGHNQFKHSPQPAQATLVGLTPARFGLFRVRSPLLTESLLFSLPGGTEMFTSPRSLHGAMNSLRDDWA